MVLSTRDTAIAKGVSERSIEYLGVEERRMYTEAALREKHIFSEILRTYSDVHELYRQARLGLGPDPAWQRKLASYEARLVRLWELRRQALAEMSRILQQAAKRGARM
jgi:hypothetical protein